MDTYDIAYASAHLPELLERAARGEVVSIVDPVRGSVRLTSLPRCAGMTKPAQRVAGRLQGALPPPPEDFFDPMTDEELRE